ncbi:MAG: hypothetical protein ABS78_06670 [Phenylobacterium sp. SCN 70-31]|nr:MAG: hypothetical protein ABS78_06670 [Phenylobacterium sp. SCN 70-31]
MAIGGGRELTYQQVEAESGRLARGLLLAGVGKGTRIGLLMPNSPDWLVCWMAALRIGAVLIGVSTFLRPRELAWLLKFADIDTLLMKDAYLRHNYVEELELALPSLATGEASRPLTVPEAPFLRSVWIWGGGRPAWARGTGPELLARGDELDREFLAEAESQVAPADLGVLIFTSGTTAHPKGVAHTQGAIVRRLFELEPFSSRADGERVGILTPLFWIGGLYSALSTMLAGGTLVFPDRPDPAYMIDFITRQKLDYLTGWAGQLNAIRQHQDFTPAVFAGLKSSGVQARSGLLPSGSAAPPERTPSMLGMTETFGPHSGEHRGTLLSEDRQGSFGRGIGAFERKVVDPQTGIALAPGTSGELLIRGPLMMEGYYKRERHEVFEPDGFFRTGDRCRILQDGHLFFEGRLGEMIKTSGANVAPEEVEQVLLAQPEVREAYVIGRPDPAMGQVVVALVVPEGEVAPDEAVLRARLGRELSAYKVPKQITFIRAEDVPRSTASGKVQKVRLLERFDLSGRTPAGAPVASTSEMEADAQ